jgi:hypothetical protein
MIEDIGSDVKDGVENIGNDIQKGMGDVEDATHGIIDDKNEIDPRQRHANERGNYMPDGENASGRRHRGAVPFGK